MLELIQELGIFIYIYCTDFVINLANLTGFSYYEVNAFIFIIIWPILTAGLMLAYLIQKVQLALVLRNKSTRNRKREGAIA